MVSSFQRKHDNVENPLSSNNKGLECKNRCTFILLVAVCYFVCLTNVRLDVTLAQLSEINKKIIVINEDARQRAEYLTNRRKIEAKFKDDLFTFVQQKKENEEKGFDQIMNTIIREQTRQRKRKHNLQEGLRDFYQTNLEQMFGSGPYYVEFTLQLEGQKQYVTMEIAPNHVQPLAVKTFLTMVDNKALDGSHIISHPHKDNIAISMPDELNGVSVIQHLAPNLLLNEYSEESPQSEGVFFCLPRRRGGPHDFYIHLHSNNSSHVPGGQEEIEFCFGEIIHGEVLVKTISSQIERNYLNSIIGGRMINVL